MCVRQVIRVEVSRIRSLVFNNTYEFDTEITFPKSKIIELHIL